MCHSIQALQPSASSFQARAGVAELAAAAEARGSAIPNLDGTTPSQTGSGVGGGQPRLIVGMPGVGRRIFEGSIR